ncbi:MAG: GNAT family N-acetyltransferase [Candidatus Krumholzibacteriia bacterium]
MEWIRGNYRISDAREELDLYYVVPALQGTYWAPARSTELIEASIAASTCLGLYQGERQIGFARAVTDSVTFAWVCDVVVHPEFRGAGLGKWLTACVLEHPTVARCEQQLLRTRDAHGLYEQYGFRLVEAMQRRTDGSVPGAAAEPPSA